MLLTLATGGVCFCCQSSVFLTPGLYAYFYSVNRQTTDCHCCCHSVVLWLRGCVLSAELAEVVAKEQARGLCTLSTAHHRLC